MRKIILLVSLFILNGCVSADFERGVHHIEPINFNYNKRTRQITINLSHRDSIYLDFLQRSCGGYGLVGVVIPIIPVWDTLDCRNLKISVSSADQVFVIYKNKTYKTISFDKKYHDYTFPLDTKSLSDGAILVIEKDGEKFEIPFRYQHTFEFQVWPGK